MGCDDRSVCKFHYHNNSSNAIAIHLLYYYIYICRRGNCSFEEKVRNAQGSGYIAAIVHNIDSNELGMCSKYIYLKKKYTVFHPH